jgi:hypothetical protein
MDPDFRPGVWNLGRWSRPIDWVAVTWVVFIVIMFMLPQYSPITVTSFNYAPVAVSVVVLFALGSWFAYGRKHFMAGRHDLVGAEAPPAEVERRD